MSTDPDKSTLLEDELKATKEALDLVITERDNLAVALAEKAEYIAAMEEHVGELNQTMNEMSARLIKLGQNSEVD